MEHRIRFCVSMNNMIGTGNNKATADRRIFTHPIKTNYCSIDSELPYMKNLAYSFQSSNYDYSAVWFSGHAAIQKKHIYKRRYLDVSH
jgi:hypothetical protein